MEIEKKIIIIILEEKLGGELKGMQTLSAAIKADIRYFFGNEMNKNLPPISLIQKILFFLQYKITIKPLKNLIRFIYPFTFNFGNYKNIYIISSSGCTFPRGKNVVAFVHTPPRMFSDLYREYKVEIKIKYRFLIVTLPLVKLLFNTIYKISMPKSTKVLSISKTIHERLDFYYNVNSNIIYQGIQLSEFSGGNFEKYFLWLSRIQRFKDPLFAMSAFNLFFSLRKDFKLVVAGAIEDTGFMAELKSFSLDRKLPIVFVTNLSDNEIKNLISNCFCLLYTSKNEDFGRVPLEAMASFKPVIAINSGGLKETIVDGVTGFLVNTIEEMSKKMEYLANELKVAIDMGNNARNHMESRFSIQRYSKEFLETLQKLNN